ncbi:YdcF family protein [Christensenellaceae bacterium OttesenSCG-928-M15]|nr:YdcF family protein [Christensenellaceae bacterium OttesenSCG-928-M15]
MKNKNNDWKRNGRVLQALKIALIVIGALGILDTLLVGMVSSPNLGVLLPAILGAPLLLCGLLFTRLMPYLEQGTGRELKWIFLIGYGGLLFAFVVTSIIIDNADHEDAAGRDILIVLGAGLRGEEPKLVLKNRLDAAIVYLNENPETTAILSGGQGPGETISEAEAMARYLSARGIEKTRYILEDQSTSTKENFAFSGAIIQSEFLENATIAYVTTDFHVLRAGLVAKKQGMDALGVAAKDVWYLSLNNHLRECVALWAYGLTGNV